MAVDTVIGKKSVEVPDPNVLNKKQACTLFKDEGNSYYVQGGKIFMLNGNLLADSETSKQVLWEIQKSDVGKNALKAAGIEVTLSAAETERTGQMTFALRYLFSVLFDGESIEFSPTASYSSEGSKT